MTPLTFVFIVSSAVLVFALISAAISHSSRVRPVSSRTERPARAQRDYQGGFGAGVTTGKRR